MSVYVDDLRVCAKNRNWPYGKSCHLVADTIGELAAFSILLPLKKEWFQEGKLSLPHFDLTEGMRLKAISLGAIEIDDSQLVDMIRKNRQRRRSMSTFSERSHIMLPAFLVNGLVALGFRLLNEHIDSDDDTTEVENAIINAHSRNEVKTIVKKELLETLDDQFLTDTDIPEDVTDGLANANSKEEIVQVLNTAQGQKSFIDTMGTLLNSVVGLIFGKKKS